MKEQRDERVCKTKKIQKGDKRSKRREVVKDGVKVERKMGWKKRGESVECRGEESNLGLGSKMPKGAERKQRLDLCEGENIEVTQGGRVVRRERNHDWQHLA